MLTIADRTGRFMEIESADVQSISLDYTFIGKRLLGFYREIFSSLMDERWNTERESVVLDCSFEVSGKQKQPFMYQFLLPEIWDEYGIFKKNPSAENRIRWRENRLRKMLYNAIFHDDKLRCPLRARKFKWEIDLLTSEFYKNRDVIFSDIWRAIKKIDGITSLSCAEFLLAIKILSNFAEELVIYESKDVDVVKLLYHLVLCVNLRPLGVTYFPIDLMTEDHPEDSITEEYPEELTTEEYPKKEENEFGEGYILRKLYKREKEELKREIKKLISEENYSEVKKEMIRITMDNMYKFYRRLFTVRRGRGYVLSIRDGLHLFLYRVFESIVRGFLKDRNIKRCPVCDKLFFPRRRSQGCCSNRCGISYRSQKDYFRYRYERLEAKKISRKRRKKRQMRKKK